MAWSASAVFQEFVKTPATARLNAAALPTGYTDLTAGPDVVKVALFKNTITPDRDAAVGSTGYNTGVWLVADEVTDATNWVAGGRAIAGRTYTDVANAMMFDATDLAGGGTLTFATATHGCFVYDDTITAGTVADQGVCFNYFGGAQQVTNGTFTIVWHANGIFRFTV